ncbi:MAG: thiamine phosphate synthase [Mariprofundaceae bacterium]|nr:thiamine phosphate synthase [Mariprofundaceae bacterium]
MSRSLTPRLLLITQPHEASESAWLAPLEAALRGGVDSVLLRKKELNSARLLALAAAMRVVTHDYGARLLIHTHVDICQAVAADGVHLSSQDLSYAADIRSQLGHAATLSASCHNLPQLQQAEHSGIDFSFLSPVFMTDSHPEALPLGVSAFEQLSAEVTMPVLALGGVNEQNRHLLPHHGVAVISALWQADNPEQTAQHLCEQGALMPHKKSG